MKNPTQFHQEIVQIVPGACAGASAIMLSYPLDTIKTRLQTNYYYSTSQAVICLYRKEGFRAFYRGVMSPLLLMPPKRGLQYYLFEKLHNHNILGHTLFENPFISGGVTGLCGTFVGCPMHILKIRMQSPEFKQYRNVRECAVDIWKQRGISGFYLGGRVNAVKDFLFGGLYLGTLGRLTRYGKTHRKDMTLTEQNIFSFMKGGIAGIITWSVLFPIDTVKTMIQSNHTFYDFKKNVKLNGMFYMWRGLTPVLIRTFPSSAISVLVYDNVLRWITHHPVQK